MARSIRMGWVPAWGAGEILSPADLQPANQDFVTRKLAKLRREKQRAEARLEDLAAVGFKPPDVDATVDAILGQLQDFPRKQIPLPNTTPHHFSLAIDAAM